MGWRLKKISENVFIYRILILLSGSALAQVIPILFSPLITRLYSPESFGEFSKILAIATILSVLLTGRYESALLLPKFRSVSVYIGSTALILTITMLFVLFSGLTVVEMLTLFPIRGITYVDALYVLLIALSLILFTIASNLVVLEQNFKVRSQGNIYRSISTALLQVTLVFIFAPKLSLSLSYALGLFIVFAYYWVFQLKYMRASFGKFNRKTFVYCLKKYRRFPIYSLPADLLNVVTRQLPILILAFYFSDALVGILALTLRIIGAPIGLIGVSVLEVFKEQASRELKEKGNCQHAWVQTLKLLTIISIPLFTLIFILSPMAFGFVFGEEWRDAGYYAQYLTPSLALGFVASPLAYLLHLQQKQNWDLLWQILLFVSTLAAMGAGVILDSPDAAILLYSVAYSFCYIIYIYMSYKIAFTNQIKRVNDDI